MDKKELLEIFSDGLEALSQRRHIDYETYKQIQKLLSENKITIGLKNKLRIWCTKCDVNMVNKGTALDCPDDGVFYVCPTCNHRIIIF